MWIFGPKKRENNEAAETFSEGVVIIYRVSPLFSFRLACELRLTRSEDQFCHKKNIRIESI